MTNTFYNSRPSSVMLLTAGALSLFALPSCRESASPKPTPASAPTGKSPDLDTQLSIDTKTLNIIREQLLADLGVRSPEWIQEHVVAPSVFIHGVTPRGGGTRGTGVFLEQSRGDAPLILTAAHNFLGEQTVPVGGEVPQQIWNREYFFESAGSVGKSGEEIRVRGEAILLAIDGGVDQDLAVLQVKGLSVFGSRGPTTVDPRTLLNPVHLLPPDDYGKEIVLGQNVAMVGSPSASGVTLGLGYISSVGFSVDGSSYIAVDATCFKGNSGGVVFSLSSGRVVGMVQRVIHDDVGNVLTLCRPIGVLNQFLLRVLDPNIGVPSSQPDGASTTLKRNPKIFIP